MNLAFFTFPYVPTEKSGKGVDRICYYIKKELVNCNHNFRLVDGSDLKGRNAFSKMLSRAFNLHKFLKKDVGSHYLAATPYSGAILSLLKRKPLVTIIHDVVPFEKNNQISYSIKSRIEKFAVKNRYKFSIKNSDLIIVPFQYTKEKLIELFGLDGKKIKVVEYGIELTQTKEEIRSKKLKKNTFTVLFIGGLNPIERGGLIIPDIAKILSSNEIDIEFIVSAKRGLSNPIIEKVNGLGISNMFKFTDFIPESELDNVLRSSDLFLYPSFLGFSLLLLQALANGLPILVSKRLDNIEFATNLGYIVEDNSPEAFAKEILKIATDVDLRASQIESSFNFIQNRSASKMALKIIETVATL